MLLRQRQQNQIVSAKNDNRLLLSKAILRQVWDRLWNYIHWLALLCASAVNGKMKWNKSNWSIAFNTVIVRTSFIAVFYTYGEDVAFVVCLQLPSGLSTSFGRNLPKLDLHKYMTYFQVHSLDTPMWYWFRKRSEYNEVKYNRGHDMRSLLVSLTKENYDLCGNMVPSNKATVGCHYSAFPYNMILHISLCRLRENMNQSLNTSPKGREN